MYFKKWLEVVDFDDLSELSITNDMQLLAYLSKEQFLANPPRGYVYDPKTEIAHFAYDRTIHLGDGFFDLPRKDRYYVIAHEIGHGIVEKIGWDKVFQLADSGILGHFDDVALKFQSFLGARKNPDETLADLFAWYFVQRSELKSKYPKQYELARELLSKFF